MSLRRIPIPAVALAAILLAGLGLRLWGIEYGLPFAYQIDEERLYTRLAVLMLQDGDLNPGYFQNPPFYTYVLQAVFAAWFGAGDAVRLIGDVPDRADLYLVARVVTALIGTAGIWLIYVAARRFFDTSVALLAAALLAVGFLPVFYSHVALNNVPAMTAVTLSLIGTAGILRRGRDRDYLLTGAAIGVAAATKYTAGIAVLPMLAAAAAAPGGRAVVRRIRRRGRIPGFEVRSWMRGAGLALAAAALAFCVANPHAVLSFAHFKRAVGTQDRLVGEVKYGQDPDGGVVFYLESWTWTLGWVPALLAIVGAVVLWRRDRRIFWTLVPVVPVFILYMGSQTRYFARWMLPVMPMVALVAAYGGIWVAREAARLRPRLAPAAFAAVTVAMLAQSLIHTVHVDRVLSRPHTLNLARSWMLENVPEGAGVVTEPFRAASWRSPWERARSSLQTSEDERQYAEYLHAGLVDEYEARGFCWVLASSHYWGLTLADGYARDRARGYYETLDREGELMYEASPWGDVDSSGGPGEDVTEFGFDFTYNFYPLSYDRPGPRVRIYRLTEGRCSPRRLGEPPPA